jgi:hypothetical protein
MRRFVHLILGRFAGGEIEIASVLILEGDHFF